MIKIVCENYLGEKMTFSRTPRMWIESISGLGADYEVTTSKNSGQDGENYTGATASKRNIVMMLDVPKRRMDDTKDRLYSFFQPRSIGIFYYYSGNIARKIRYYVESIEPEESGLVRTITISLICPDPKFYALTDNLTELAVWEGMITFPLRLPPQINAEGQNVTLTVDDSVEDYDKIAITGQTVQDGSGNPSPDNIRTIHGVEYIEKWSGAPAENRNLLTNLPSNWEYGGVTDGENTASGLSNKTRVRTITGVNVLPNTQYTFTCPTSITYGIHQLAADNGTFIVETGWHNAAVYTFTTTSTTTFLRFIFRYNVESYIDINEIGNSLKLKLEKGDNATSWTSAPEDLPSYQKIMLPQPLYNLPNGAADSYEVISATGTQKIKKNIFDGTENDWSTGTANGRTFFSIFITRAANAESGQTVHFLCSHFRPGYSGAYVYIANYGAMVYFYPLDTSITTIDAWKSYLAAQYAAGTPVTILYELAVPQPITGTPQTIPIYHPTTTLSLDAGTLALRCRGKFVVTEKINTLIGNVVNPSAVPMGLTVTFRASGAVVNPSLYDVNRQELMQVNTTMHAGDQIIITTGEGNKRVKLISGGVTSNINNLMAYPPHWLKAYQGDNLFRYNADEGIDNLSVSILSTQAYWGA